MAKMAKEKTLMIIKPDGMKHKDEIIKRVNQTGLKIAKQKQEKAKTNVFAEFYAHVKPKNKKVYNNLVSYMSAEEIILLLIQGENAIGKIRSITGSTDPEFADKGTIRGDLGTDSILKANQEGRPVWNLIHASGTPEEAEKEIKLWFGES